MHNKCDSLVIGGGAAGIFAAIAARETNPSHSVVVLERTRQLLSKVKISGGGRCNVTHACFDPPVLVNYYPRGCKALRGPFNRFQPQDTIAWFEARGVALKVEEDGRMFPVTDDSQTIIDCLLSAARESGVVIALGQSVKTVERQDESFLVTTEDCDYRCENLLLATGSSPNGHNFAKHLGHTIVPPVPSLFTFNIPTSPLLDLAGISVDNVSVSLEGSSHVQKGPLLLTHWGFSGPAILKMSAWAARDLHTCDYQTTVYIRWVEDFTLEAIREELELFKGLHSARLVYSEPLFHFPKNLWRRFVGLSGISETQRWANLSQKSLITLAQKLYRDPYRIEGKTTYKSEFVIAGGIDLDEVNFKTMESRRVPHLYFAGEILDIDGVTGGFNFQNAWTTGYLAGNAMGQRSGV